MSVKRADLKEVESYELANALLREQLHRERLNVCVEKREAIVARLAIEHGLKLPLSIGPDGSYLEGESVPEMVPPVPLPLAVPAVSDDCTTPLDNKHNQKHGKNKK